MTDRRLTQSRNVGRPIDDFPEVLAAMQAGEDWAAAIIFDSLHPVLLRYLRWQEPAAAEDLAGETWLAVAERIGRFEGDEGSLRSWVFSVARRRVADHRRRRARRGTRPAPPEVFAERPGGMDTADLVVGTLSAQQAIAGLVKRLSPEQAEVVVLRVVVGLSTEDVARVLGKRPGTVRVLQHRALQRLALHGRESLLAPRNV